MVLECQHQPLERVGTCSCIQNRFLKLNCVLRFFGEYNNLRNIDWKKSNLPVDEIQEGSIHKEERVCIGKYFILYLISRTRWI